MIGFKDEHTCPDQLLDAILQAVKRQHLNPDLHFFLCDMQSLEESY